MDSPAQFHPCKVYLTTTKTKELISIPFSFRMCFSLAVVGGKLTAANNLDFELLEDEGWRLKRYNGPTPPFLDAVSYALVPK